MNADTKQNIIARLRKIVTGNYIESISSRFYIYLVVIVVFILCGQIINYKYQSLQRKMDQIQKEITDTENQLITNHSKLTNLTRQTKIQEILNEHGSQLQINKKPIIRIIPEDK